MRKQPKHHEISIEFEGKTYKASYYVESKVVTMQSAYGSLSTQVGGSRGDFVARMLFREIFYAAKSRGEL